MFYLKMMMMMITKIEQNWFIVLYILDKKKMLGGLKRLLTTVICS